MLVLPRQGLTVTRGIRITGRTDETCEDKFLFYLVMNTHTCHWEPPGALWPSAGQFLLQALSG